MASIESMLKGFERMRVDLEQRQAQQEMLFGGYKQLLAIRVERLLANSSEQEAADFLKRYNEARRRYET